MSNKIYPIGIQNFEKIRKGGYCYIDKTAWILEPFESDGRTLFKIGVNFSAETRNIEKWVAELQ